MRKPTLVAAALVVVAVAAGGWAWQRNRAPVAPASGTGAAAGGAASAPAVSVTSVVTQRRDWPVMLTATGTVTALNTVDVRPQTSSVITRVNIREGQFVKAGETLFTLDSRSDDANRAKAAAQLQKDLAALADAERQLARSQELVRQNFISQSALDTNLTAVASQQAVVAADRAALAAAAVSVGYNRIVAPSPGRAGAINVYAGSLVQPTGTPLVTITQLDPIAVSFTLPQRNLGDALAGLRAGNVPVQAQLPDGRGTLEGKLQFVDNAVDAASGTVKVKAVFDNRDLLLWPGAYVTVQLRVQTLKDAIVVPQAAIVQGPTARSVFVIGSNGKAAQRPVEVLASGGTEAVVSGLEPGVRVVVEGKQNLRPGSSVRERPADAGPDGKPRAGRAARGASAASGTLPSGAAPGSAGTASATSAASATLP